MSRTPTLECKPDGPYVAKDLEALYDAAGQRIATKPVVALCRCGGSKNKPFCNGTHQKIGFSAPARREPAAGKRDTYAGRRITIHDNRGICAHAGYCTDRLAAVFKYGSEPWIDPDGAAPEAVIEAIRSCPSGALGYSLDGVEARDAAREPAVTVMRDGPYAVAGGVRLADAARAEGASEQRYTLCRCGGSKNKPFCDGSHWSIGFKDAAG